MMGMARNQSFYENFEGWSKDSTLKCKGEFYGGSENMLVLGALFTSKKLEFFSHENILKFALSLKNHFKISTFSSPKRCNLASNSLQAFVACFDRGVGCGLRR